MLTILSPAKNMRSPLRSTFLSSVPHFITDAEFLHKMLTAYTPYELESLMKISPALALKACDLFTHWQSVGGCPAILSYDGLAYKHLSADDLTDDDLAYAQNHLRILSALYGVLRPLDAIHPYRLEMAHKPSCGSLYHYWGDKIHADLFQHDEPVVNLCSGEYSKAVLPFVSSSQLFITCEFLTYRRGKLTCLATQAKMARGEMARYIICNRIDTPSELINFHWDGFTFEPTLSDRNTLTFVQQR